MRLLKKIFGISLTGTPSGSKWQDMAREMQEERSASWIWQLMAAPESWWSLGHICEGLGRRAGGRGTLQGAGRRCGSAGSAQPLASTVDAGDGSGSL